jgi:hypothetical protein
MQFSTNAYCPAPDTHVLSQPKSSTPVVAVTCCTQKDHACTSFAAHCVIESQCDLTNGRGTHHRVQPEIALDSLGGSKSTTLKVTDSDYCDSANHACSAATLKSTSKSHHGLTPGGCNCAPANLEAAQTLPSNLKRLTAKQALALMHSVPRHLMIISY